MHTFFSWSLRLLLIGLVLGCVDPYELTIPQTVDVVVVDGTITNQEEQQVVRLSRSKTISGQSANVPLTGAQVVLVVDSLQVIALTETENGHYQLPSDFRGEVGHRYQLRFQLADGNRYESSTELMPAAPPITKVSAQFNPNSLPPDPEGYTAAHDFFLDTQDPANERNYYKWDWTLWEKQEWCRSCSESVYAVYNVFYYDNDIVYKSGDQPYEDCWSPPEESRAKQNLRKTQFDYICRTRCWEIIRNHELNLFDDGLTNGGLIQNRKVAQIPYYQYIGCLVEIRQSALTKEAHRFYQLLQSQTQRTGGIADTPPVVPVGNVKNTANSREVVVGFFTASGSSTLRYWLTRSDAFAKARGLFRSLNGRDPMPEPAPPFGPYVIEGGVIRPPTALCVPSDSRTPLTPAGWRE